MLNTIYCNINQLFSLVRLNTRPIYDMALKSRTSNEFKTTLKTYLINKLGDEEEINNQIKGLITIIDNDNRYINDTSTDQNVHILTITYLWEFINDKLTKEINPDLLIDLYNQFIFVFSARKKERNTLTSLEREMQRWPEGSNSQITAIHQENKNRIIGHLITKIETHHSVNSKFQFSENDSYEEKREKVYEWWDSHIFQLSMAIKSPSTLNLYLERTLSVEIMHYLHLARKKGIPFFITPYYLSLLSIHNEYDDLAIRSYIIYSRELVETYGSIKAWEKEDILEDGKPNTAGWFLPDGENIHRRYPDVAILIPDSMGRACGGLCSSCQRMYNFQSKKLNFDLDTLAPKEGWNSKLERLMRYFREDTQLRDILITGGDALMSKNTTLKNLLDSIYNMSLLKIKDNLSRPDGDKYAQLQRVRIGTRLLAYIPMRINEELISILRNFKEKASKIGIKQFIIQTHFQSPLEVTTQSVEAIEKLISAGWIVTNQLVFTAAASRRGHAAKLRQILNQYGVLCYYTFTVKGFNENYAVYAPNSRSIQEQYEEKRFGYLNDEHSSTLCKILASNDFNKNSLELFIKENNLPFLATDKSVLNLPGIGKSMEFTTIGITADGKRIQQFSHEKSRKHSPIIDKSEDVYIVENKSIAAYLRTLEDMNENSQHYESIWQYLNGKNENRFEFYKYPNYDYIKTDKFTNIGEL